MATPPPFLNQPPLQVYPPFLAKMLYPPPPSDQLWLFSRTPLGDCFWIKFITDALELNIWIWHVILFFELLLLKLKQEDVLRSYSSFYQNISVFIKDIKNHKTYFKPFIRGQIIFQIIWISFKTFRSVYFGLLVHFAWWLFHLGKCLCHELCLDYTYNFFFQNKKFWRWAAHGSSSKNECSSNNGKKKQLWVKFLFNVLRSKQWRNTLF